MSDYDLIKREHFNAPSFSLHNRVKRALWMLVWTLGARWTPPPLHFWRILLLRAFGARIAGSARVHASVDVWAPWNLDVAEFAMLGRGARLYNIAPITVGYKAIISQGAYLCTGTHDYNDPSFPLTARPINVGEWAWVCAEAFVGPGVNVRAGAVLGAASVTTRDLEPWTVYSGNPAVSRRQRRVLSDGTRQ